MIILKKRTRKTYTNEILHYDVIDGDTIHCTLDLGYNIYHKTTVRLRGIDTPELKGNLLEKLAANRVKDLLDVIISKSLNERYIDLDSYEKNPTDGYGRVIGDIYIASADKNLTYLLITYGVARPYKKEEGRKPWTDQDLNLVIKKCDEASEKLAEGKWQW